MDLKGISDEKGGGGGGCGCFVLQLGKSVY